MEWLIKTAAKIGLFGKMFSLLGQGYTKLKGFKTQVLLVLAAVAYIAGYMGWIDKPTADKLVDMCLAASGVTFMDKIATVTKILEDNKTKIAGPLN